MSFNIKGKLELKGKSSANPNIVTKNLILYIDPNNRKFPFLGNTTYKNIAIEPYTKFNTLTSNQPLLSSLGVSKFLDFSEGKSLVTETNLLTSTLKNYSLHMWVKDNTSPLPSNLNLTPIIVGGKNTITINSSAIEIDNLDVDTLAYNFDGKYIKTGTFNGKDLYSKPSIVWPNLPMINYVYWLSADNSWNITYQNTFNTLTLPHSAYPPSPSFEMPCFKSSSSAEFPWQVTSWNKKLSSISLFSEFRGSEILDKKMRGKLLREIGIYNGEKYYQYEDGNPLNTIKYFYDASSPGWFVDINNTTVLSSNTVNEAFNYLPPMFSTRTINLSANFYTGIPINSQYISIKDKKASSGYYNFYNLNSWDNSPGPNYNFIPKLEYNELPKEVTIENFSETYSYLNYGLSGIFFKSFGQGYDRVSSENNFASSLINYSTIEKRWYIYGYNYFGPYQLYQSEIVNNPTTPGDVTTWSSAVTSLCAYGGTPSLLNNIYISYGDKVNNRLFFESIPFNVFSDPLGYIFYNNVPGFSGWSYILYSSTTEVVAFTSNEDVEFPWEVQQWGKAQSTAIYGFEATMPILRKIDLPTPIVTNNIPSSGWMFFLYGNSPTPSFYSLHNFSNPLSTYATQDLSPSPLGYLPYYDTPKSQKIILYANNPRIPRFSFANEYAVNENFDIIPSSTFSVTTGDNFYFIDNNKQFGFFKGGKTPISTLGLKTSGNNWNLLVFNVSGRNIELYKNLKYESIVSIDENNYSASLSTFSIGFRDYDIGHVMLYDRFLTKDEILQNYNSLKTKYEGLNNVNTRLDSLSYPEASIIYSEILDTPLFRVYPPRSLTDKDVFIFQYRDDDDEPADTPYYLWRRKKHMASRAVILDIRIINGVSTIVNSRVDDRPTVNNLDLIEIIKENNLLPSQEGQYIYGFSFSGWRKNTKDYPPVELVSSDSNYIVYRRKL